MAVPDPVHVLIVDDDREIRDLLGRFFGRSGYRTTTARDGREMRKALADSRIDVVVLDLMLPGEDGLALCRELRAKSNRPVIMLTARGDDTDRIVGFEMGADDYLPKPFNPRELEARVKAVLRRARSASGPDRPARSNVLVFSRWKFDLAKRRLESPDSVEVDLTSGEFDLLVAFAERPQRVLSRDQLIDLTRGRSAAPYDRSIDVLVSRLRRKLEPNSKSPELIKTVRSGGYLFTSPVERP